MKNVHEPTYSFVILTLVLIVVNTLISRFCVIALPGGVAGVSALYFAVAFTILFTLWFGAYGAIAAYAGTLIGSGLLSGDPAIPPVVAIYWSIAGLLQVLIPLVAFRTFKVDPALENRRDWTLLLLFGVLINNIVGAAWGACTLAFGNVIASSQIGSVFFIWLIGNVIVTIIIIPLALRFGTPHIRKTKIFVRNYWD
jgi:integral membrane sensor domain MASE1